MADQEAAEEKVVTTNRKARHDYEILDTYEAGIVLTGTEVKSLRQGNANLSDSYAMLKSGELWLLGMHISPYVHGSYANVDPIRNRKLLLHKKELLKLHGKLTSKGLTLVPLKVYFTHNIAKILLGLARGKREYDRREDIAKRDAERSIRQRLRR
jgi:SsrA-binding protein